MKVALQEEGIGLVRSELEMNKTIHCQTKSFGNRYAKFCVNLNYGVRQHGK